MAWASSSYKFKQATTEGTQDLELDEMPEWFRNCKNNKHLTDTYIEDSIIHFECSTCNNEQSYPLKAPK